MCTSKNNALIADFLRKNLGSVKILVVIREQYSMIYSLWKQQIEMGRSIKLKEFVRYPNMISKVQNKNNSMYTKICYHEYVKKLKRTFGNKKVKVMFMEDLKKDHQNFINQISNLLKIKKEKVSNEKINLSLGYYETEVFRYINKFTETQFKNGFFPKSVWRKFRKLATKTEQLKYRHLKSLFREKPSIEEMVPKKFNYMIEKSNRVLNKEVSKDIKSLGYKT